MGLRLRWLVMAASMTLPFATPESAGAAGADTILVSRASGATGAGGDALSGFAHLSADGRSVLFDSEAGNLTAEGEAARFNAFVRKLDSNQTILASRATGASGAIGNDLTGAASISANGRFVVFNSFATNITSEDDDTLSPSDWADVFLRDLQTNTTTLVSRGPGLTGVAADGGSLGGSISADGRYVAFFSHASNLTADADTGAPQIFVRDLQTGANTLVSRATGPTGAVGGDHSDSPVISADGSVVAFASRAENLSGADNDALDAYDVFVRDLGTAATELVSRANGANGTAGDGHSWEPSVSDDGRLVAFTSSATTLSAADNDLLAPEHRFDVFVRDVDADTTTLISRAGGAVGAAANAGSGYPSISGDGEHVAFASAATNFTADVPRYQGVYVRDLETQRLRLVSRASGEGGQPADHGAFPWLSGDGSAVAFESATDFFSDADSDRTVDIFLRDLRPDTTPPDTTIASGPAGETTDATPTFAFAASEGGSRFECRVDAGPFAACANTHTTAALPLGARVIEARAIDAANNSDGSPARRAFTVVAGGGGGGGGGPSGGGGGPPGGGGTTGGSGGIVGGVGTPLQALLPGARRPIRVGAGGRFTYRFSATPGASGIAALRSAKVRVGRRMARIWLLRRTFTVPASGRVALRAKLSRKALRILRVNRRIRATMTVILKDAGNASTRSKAPVVLRR
jgi:Tol biopolymer transport system component